MTPNRTADIYLISHRKIKVMIIKKIDSVMENNYQARNVRFILNKVE